MWASWVRIKFHVLLKKHPFCIQGGNHCMGQKHGLLGKEKNYSKRGPNWGCWWISRISLRDGKRNEVRTEARVVKINKIRETRIIWLGHMSRREDEDLFRMAHQHPVEGRRSVVRQRRWKENKQRRCTGQTKLEAAYQNGRPHLELRQWKIYVCVHNYMYINIGDFPLRIPQILRKIPLKFLQN